MNAELEQYAKARWMQLQELVAKAQNDPVRSLDLAQQMGTVMRELQMVGYPLNPRAGAAKVYRQPAIPVLAGGDENIQPIKWAQAGVVLSMYGMCLDDDAGRTAMTRAGLNLRSRAGDNSLVVDGESESVAAFSALFTESSPWFPLTMWVFGEDTTWQLRLVNMTAAGAPVSPLVHFTFVPLPPKLVRVMSEMWGTQGVT